MHSLHPKQLRRRTGILLLRVAVAAGDHTGAGSALLQPQVAQAHAQRTPAEVVTCTFGGVPVRHHCSVRGGRRGNYKAVTAATLPTYSHHKL